LIGSKLGPYEITAKLGEGGMGEVFRARDTKLERDVAIKVLPAAFTEDAERLARFEREAKLLAQLHHPHIASIFGLEQSDETRGLVMELVEGPTLAEWLERGARPIEESLGIARQIAEALEAAHEKGIVHRDLKPQNVKLTPDGKVKVLDFGLAKAMDPVGAASGAPAAASLAASPTLTLGATVQGVILGTAAYMAPEQAKGFAVDPRADVWAFGVVLFEMLAGTSLFVGDSVPDTLARVLQRPIDLEALPAATPAAVRRLLRRCLERQPRNRLHSIADARIVIDEVLQGRDEETAAKGEATVAAAPRGRAALVVGAAVAAGLALGWALATLRSPAAPPLSSERRFTIAAEDRSSIDRQAISPGGERIAYTAGGGLWLRALEELEPRRISGGDGAREPFWSPDGHEIAFVREGALWRLAVEGGAPKRICELPAGIFDGGTWTEAGEVVFALATGGWTGSLYRCPAAGGRAETLLAPERIGLRFRRPQALPDGAGLLFSVTDRSTAGEVRQLRGEETRTLLRRPRSLTAAVLAPDRRLYFAEGKSSGDDLWVSRLDSAGEEPSGEPALFAESALFPSVSRGSTLVFSQVENAPIQLALVDRDGAVAPVGEPFVGQLVGVVLQASPDGARASMVLPDSRESDAQQVWIVDLATGARQRLPLGFRGPLVAWSPDGQRLFVKSDASDSLVLPLSGTEGRVTLAPGHPMFQPRWTPDGEWIVYYTVTPESGRDLYRISAAGDGAPEPLLREPGEQVNPDVSPDGRFLAYQSDESGRPEIYVRPYPTGERKWQVSTAGGVSPIWNRQGGELVWSGGDAIWSAAVRTTGGDFEAGAPRRLVEGAAVDTDLSAGDIYYNRMIDLSADGRRFLVARRAGPERNEIVYVENPGGGAAP